MGRLQLSLVILTVFVCKSDCSSYHIGFLGRKVWNATSSIGEIRFRPSASTTTITSAYQTSTCTSPASPSGATATDPKILTFNAPDCVNFIPNGNEKAEKGMKIESPDNLSLHVYQNDANGKPGDGYLAIPDEHLGNKYYVNTYCSLGGTCQFAVAGVLDGTSVKIVFPTNNGTICSGTATVDASKGTALPFMINEFDILHFESDQDLTGTYISSDKKVAVFVGSRDVPSRNNTIFTNMIEQIPPVSNWGTTFVVAPNHLNEQGDQIKILTATDNTKIHILGFSTFRIPSKGSHVVRRMDWHLYGTIEASNPVLIMQIMSMNLYNNSSSENGAPSMVLVPHIQQWLITPTDFFYCQYLPSQPLTQITIISKTASYLSVPLEPNPAASVLQSWTYISTTPYSVYVIQPKIGVLKTQGEIYAYGYCNGTAAVLLGANWQWKNTGCKETLPYPGDGKDNNCNGQIDEVNCTMDDLKLAFNTSQNPNGSMTFKRISVGGVAPPIKVSVQTCDVAVITLADNSTYSRSTFTVLISKSEMVVQLCTPDCTVTQIVPNTVIDCLVYTDYYIGWERILPNTRHTIRLGTWTASTFDQTVNGQIDYVDMMVTSLTGPASFIVDLPEKDCNKIISNEADNFGKEFLVPNLPGTTDIFVTTNSSAADVTVLPAPVPGSTNISVSQQTTQKISYSNSASPTTIKITSTQEVSVYVIRKTLTGKVIGFSVLPTDVLGPSYHLYKATYENSEVCKVLPKWSNTETNIGIKNELTAVTVPEYNTLGKKHLLEANKPMAVFCGIKDDTFVHIPPAESLGKQFYIPKIDFTAFNVQSANMTIIATEDSTVVITKGDYDLLDSIDLTVDSNANFYTRSLDSNFRYNITSTYPVQVQLELNSSSGNTLVMIPPVSQYKNYHVYPKFTSSTNTPVVPTVRSSVTDAGLDVSSAPGLDINPVTYPVHTFSLTLYIIDSANNINIIYPSDVFYKVTNKGCYISTGTPGDHEDNDCDGLVDEENCSTTNIRGEIDYDIDGALNEDCAVNTAGPSSAITLSLPTNTCSAVTPGTVPPDTTIPTQDEDLIVIDIEPGNQSNTLISFPNYITIRGTRIKLQNLTADGKLTVSTPLVVNATSGNQTVPEETCRTDCLCPCGWVEQKNYTKAQIEETVREIQEKLKVTKDELSAIVRTKISASDDRPAATAIGIVGGAFFIAVIGLVVLLDVTALFRDLQMMIGNLRQVFQP